MTRTYEHDHLVGRIAGEGPEHPRQEVARWLYAQGHSEKLAAFNQAYEETLAYHYESDLLAKESFACYQAFGSLYPEQGGAGTPAVDELWFSIFHPT